MKRLLQFAASQENVDRVAMFIGIAVAVLGVPLAIVTIVVMVAK